MSANYALADPTTLVELSQAELINLLRTSDEFFIEYFLADEMDSDDEVQDFHLMVFKRFTDLSQRKEVIALPRDHAKTTYLRLAILKLIFFSPVQFFVYVSATHGLAVASLLSIWNRIVGSEGQAAFGIPDVIVQRLSEGHLEFTVTAYDEKGEPYEKLVILKALGAEQTLRGMNLNDMRPEYAACDDIEDETAVKTAEGYRKFKHWFDNTFMRAISRRKGRSKIAQIGNLIGLETLLNDNIKDPEWRSVRLGVLRKNGEPLWPSRFPKSEILADYNRALRRGGLSAWMGEMMNMPYNVDNALIDIESIYFTPQRSPADPDQPLKTFITIDPAISKRTSADSCAVVLHSIDVIGHPQISEYIHSKGMDPFDIVNAVIELSLKWNCYVVFIEDVQLQTVLVYFFDLFFASNNMQGYTVLGLPVGQSHKTTRIMSWASTIKAKDYSIAEGDWGVSSQLISFDTRKDNNADDLIDACSMGLIAMSMFMMEILRGRVQTENPLIQASASAGSTAY